MNLKDIHFPDPATFHEELGIAFVCPKLCQQVDRSWWLVLLPIYGPWIVRKFLKALLDELAKAKP